jgi:hypothetical protein
MITETKMKYNVKSLATKSICIKIITTIKTEWGSKKGEIGGIIKNNKLSKTGRRKGL